MSRGRILFVNRFYYPDHSATAQLLTDLAEALAARGWTITVIASQLRYDDITAKLKRYEDHSGVAIHRVRTTRFGRSGLAGRAIDYLSFYVMAFFAVLILARRRDVVVAKTDPPMLSVVIALASRLRGARLVNWLQDLYPEVAAELGVAVMRGPVGAMLQRLRNASLRSAICNVAIGERMSERLLEQGVPPARVRVMHNWTDEESIRPVASACLALRDDWGLRRRFVVGYSGNLGRAHEAETVLGAAHLLREGGNVVFLMIGKGRESERLEARVVADGLSSCFQFRPYQPRERLGESLGVADIHWLSLRPELEGLIVPSKFYGIAAAGRPVIAVSDPDGEIGRLVTRQDCGVVIRPGDSVALAEAIRTLAADPARVAAMGQAARTMVERDYGRGAAFDRWERLLSEVSA
jgi:glycosyltransferase involved in cell wall biosynthesis